MKGLLLKDLYALWAYMKAFLLMDVVFIVAGRFTQGNSFLLFYPSIFSSMLSLSLIAYEEREKWHEYALTLPFTRRQLVSAKYLLTLLVSAAVVCAICLVQLTRPDGAGQVLGILFTMVPLSLLPAALLLPFVYRLGSEKGRIAYYMVLGAFMGLITLANTAADPESSLPTLISSPATGIGLLLLTAGLYLLSWQLSVYFYEKREL